MFQSRADIILIFYVKLNGKKLDLTKKEDVNGNDDDEGYGSLLLLWSMDTNIKKMLPAKCEQLFRFC